MVNLNQTLASSDNGTWTYAVTVSCSEPARPTPSHSYRIAGPVLEVDIQVTTAPVITQQPQNVAVTEGGAVALGVNASGSGLNYQWQRSNDAGLNYANVPGANARTLSFNAALTDDTSLWRVVVSNAGGQTVSTPALLTVAQRVVAPAITSDPSSQDVTEGQTASFTVLGTGTPAPAVQWQTRAATQADAEAGWSDISGATANTYVIAAASLSQQGRQYRALLRNSGGTAASAAATLTVRAALVAPAIVQGPQSTSVQAGQSGLFSVAVSGSTPLSYQWFKDGQAITGANASEVLIPAGAADVGSVWQITVQVSNAAGSVGSEAAQMSVVAVPDTGTLVVAKEGAVLQTGADDSGATLVIDANALSANASISLTTEASSVVNLPADVQPLGDVVNIGPAGVDFAVPATLNLPIPVDVPEGKVLGVLEIQSVATANASGAGSKRQVKGKRTAMQAGQPSEVPTPGNLRRLAAQTRSGLGMVVLGASDALTIRCPDAQSVRGGRALVDLAKTGMRFLAAAVPESLCSGGTTSKQRKTVPSTSTAPCASGDFPAQAGELNQLSRHVHCQRDQAELDLGYSPAEGPAKYFGRYLLSWKIGSDGTPKKPYKNYRVKLRLTPVDTAGAQPLTGLTVKPVFECGSSLSQGQCNAQGATRALGSNSEVEINTTVTFSWDGGKDTYKEFTMGQIALRMAFPGEDIDKAGRTVYLSAPPTIRCDNMMADGSSKGCVYAQAPAVLVMSKSDPLVREAALHIDDAQKAGANGALIVDADGSLHAAASNALQRTVVLGLKGDESRVGANRNFACIYSASVIKLRPQSSATCPADGKGCQCDEYPFNATWNGAYSTRGGLPSSARFINGKQNSEAGNWLGRFYATERNVSMTLRHPGTSI